VENLLLSDEEQKIMEGLNGLQESEKIKILEDSFECEPEDSSRRVLRTLILKLKGGL
jgi:hypothetical protein